MANEKKVEETINPNLEFWNKYKSVPKNALKDFDNGNFKGTDINTMWRLKCLTETFGMCGFGWYYDLVRTWVETTQNGEQFAFAEIKLYVKGKDGEWSKGISGNGGNKLLRNTKNGLKASDEAFKMAVTDAIGVACRNLGIGADVYWENDKTKYTEGDKEAKEEKQKPVSEQIKKSEYGLPNDVMAILTKYHINEGTFILKVRENLGRNDVTEDEYREFAQKIVDSKK